MKAIQQTSAVLFVILLCFVITTVVLSVILLVRTNEQTSQVVTTTCAQTTTTTSTSTITTTAPQNPLNIIDWRSRSIYHQHRIQVIVLHDTETKTAEETVDVLNYRNLSVHYIAERNGTIYYLVEETERAYHAGTSGWGSHVGLNDASIGIEIVNSGVDPFPDVQVKAVAALCRTIIDRWNIVPNNIVAHGDIIPSIKHDVSGYFNWTMFYAELGIFPGLFNSNLTSEEQEKVLLSQQSPNTTAINASVTALQQRLSDYGYVSEIDVNGIFDTNTIYVVQAFNRHFCPEIFIKEPMDSNGDSIPNPANQQWYGISEERLAWLLENTQRDLCAQC